MRIIKDLVPDLTHVFAQYRLIEPWLQTKTPAPEKERLQLPEERRKLDGCWECILCFCCTSGCPSHWWNTDRFLGPAVLLQAQRWLADSRDEATGERLDNLEELPVPEWQCVLKDSHRGYINWDRYLANQQRLAQNATAFGKERSSGPVREGPALLQGRVLCGVCGAHMTMQYNHVRQTLLPIYMCQEESVRRGRRICQQIRGIALDQAISALLIELMTPMTVDIALAVQQEIEARIVETDTLPCTQLERARYGPPGRFAGK